MELPLTNLTKENVSKYHDLVTGIIGEDFPELRNKYEVIKTIVFRSGNTSPDIVEKEVNDFMGVPCFAISEVTFPSLRNYAIPPKACLQIDLSLFENFPYWEQKYSVRHECFIYPLKKTSLKL